MTEVVFAENDQALQSKLSGHGDLENNLSDRQRIVGTGTQIVDHIGLYVEAGVQRFMLQWLNLDDLDGLEKLAKAVLPHFHK